MTQSARPEDNDQVRPARSVLDYQVGDLWTRGIDGTRTTIAVIEGWDSLDTASYVASHDKMLGLPNPQITTIYPRGRHRLPATCPPAMAKLTGYGSCRSWGAEAALQRGRPQPGCRALQPWWPGHPGGGSPRRPHRGWPAARRSLL